MKLFRSVDIQKCIVGVCLVLGVVSWQASAADEVYIDHKHCVSHEGDHDHEDDHHGDNDHTSHHHHCPNCSAHFVGLTSTVTLALAGHIDIYQKIQSDRSLLCAEAPPTPPPNL